ncbi:TIGR03067 domain-containing protein [Cytophagaceae bacterium DM2B3-1]|uniref:TIGR03067 domain-containing protein n=1 Tax=Xanthocytophaga flava TaxID=3048013 RepID=A0ABT7CG55_9BACT|nr:TIGR03067 domain-containing protein [Xanthocytophaga flavus]MDJ1466726.1 TIGR03067 domain-containing protein [Xanthocytophaga flavus]MDJ1492722.1 TIGR03067 domain-containing protein [Xanthocytophaga flavus]
MASDAAKSTDQANIQGVWLAQSESQNGLRRNVSYLYVFTEDKLTFTDETKKEIRYSFKLDTTSKPKLIVIQSEETPTDSAPVSVGYELNGGSLKIVVAPAGLRPTDISDKNNQELILCKRKDS